MLGLNFRTVLPVRFMGLILWPGNIVANDQPISAAPDLTARVGVRIPPEIQKWMDRTTALSAISSGSYPASDLLDCLPLHVPKLLETDEMGGTPLALEVADPQVFDVPVSERVHQLKPMASWMIQASAVENYRSRPSGRTPHGPGSRRSGTFYAETAVAVPLNT